MTTIAVRAHRDPTSAPGAWRTARRNLIGNNIGNLVFAQAAWRLLSRDDQDLVVLEPRVDAAPRGTERIVLPLANAFRKSFAAELERLTDLIVREGVPVTVLGVGSQTDVAGRKPSHGPLDAAATRFVSTVLERSPSVGVRGERTYDYLRRLGFPDDAVDVIGCPSMFMHGPELPPLRMPTSIGDDSRIAFNISPYRKKAAHLVETLVGRHPHLTYFPQDVETLRLMLSGRLENKQVAGMPTSLDHPLFAPGRTHFCLDPVTWMADLAQHEYSVGTRVHGTVAALLAGTPATVVTHDSRTMELAELHEIPRIPLARIDTIRSAADAFEASDWGPMVAAHPGNWQRFAAFLDRHGLGHAFAPGHSPAAFDARLAAVRLPSPVVSIGRRPISRIARLRGR